MFHIFWQIHFLWILWTLLFQVEAFISEWFNYCTIFFMPLREDYLKFQYWGEQRTPFVRVTIAISQNIINHKVSKAEGNFAWRFILCSRGLLGTDFLKFQVWGGKSLWVSSSVCICLDNNNHWIFRITRPTELIYGDIPLMP